MNLGNSLWLIGIVAEALVLALLGLRGVWRVLPVFTLYCVWDLVGNGLVLTLTDHSATSFLKLFLVLTVVDAIFIMAVLTEVFWSVLRPLHSSLPRQTIYYLLAFLGLIAAFAWPFTSAQGFGKFTSLVIHIQQVSALLRIVVFIILVALSQFLSLSWRDRELQIATGLGFYSLVSFGAMLAHTHKANVLQYSTLNELVIGSYLCSLLYWVYSFAQKEAKRHEFTPQMQNVLLAMAGVAREQRLALAQAAVERSRNRS
jgi:hypothetical protein